MGSEVKYLNVGRHEVKKTLYVLALGAMIMGLNLGAVPAAAVSVESEAVTTSASSVSEKVAAAVKQAEAALDATAGGAAGTVANAKEVAAMRTYLQGWVQQAQTINIERLTAAQAKELIAALEEGARGLRMTAGVDRKVSSSASSATQAGSSTAASVNGANAGGAGNVSKPAIVASASSNKEVISTTVPEPKVMKELAVETIESGKIETDGAKMKAEVALVNLATAQVKKPTAASSGSLDSEVADSGDVAEVPKTGASDEEKASTAARGMGLVLGGAVVFAAAAGAVLIVKRMKRDL